MPDPFLAASHLSRTQEMGLYATPDVRGVRGLSVLGLFCTSLFTVGLGAVAVLAWRWDTAKSQGGNATAWFFTIAFLPWAIYLVRILYGYLWRIAVLQRRIPVVAFVREGVGLIVVPVRYMGIRHGRARVIERGPRLDKDSPWTLKRGDEVHLAVEGPDSMFGMGRRSHIRLLLDAPGGFFRSRVGLDASELDLEGFEALLKAEGVSVSYGSLYEF